MPIDRFTFLGDSQDDRERTARKTFSQRDRQLAWDREFGPDKDRAKCPLGNCRNIISRNNFVMGHRRSLKNGGSNQLRNIRPICAGCNSQMSDMNMGDFVKKYRTTKKPNTETKTKKTKEEKPDPFTPYIPLFPGEDNKKPSKKKTTSQQKRGKKDNFDERIRFLE